MHESRSCRFLKPSLGSEIAPHLLYSISQNRSQTSPDSRSGEIASTSPWEACQRSFDPLSLPYFPFKNCLAGLPVGILALWPKRWTVGPGMDNQISLLILPYPHALPRQLAQEWESPRLLSWDLIYGRWKRQVSPFTVGLGSWDGVSHSLQLECSCKPPS